MKPMYNRKGFMSVVRKIVMASLLGLMLGAPATVHAETVGVVDFGKILLQMPERKQAETTLQAMATPFQNELERMSQDLQKGLVAYEQQKASMAKPAREVKEKELNTKAQAIQKYKLEKFGQEGLVAKKEQELLIPIRQKIVASVQTIAQKEGFTLVLDKGAMIYGTPASDLTFKVMNQLNLK